MIEDAMQEDERDAVAAGPGPEDLRWPLVLGTVLVLYGSLTVALQLLRIFWVAQIFLGFAGNPPGPLVFIAIFTPIFGGILLGLMLFLGGVLDPSRTCLFGRPDRHEPFRYRPGRQRQLGVRRSDQQHRHRQPRQQHHH